MTSSYDKWEYRDYLSDGTDPDSTSSSFIPGRIPLDLSSVTDIEGCFVLDLDGLLTVTLWSLAYNTPVS